MVSTLEKLSTIRILTELKECGFHKKINNNNWHIIFVCDFGGIDAVLFLKNTEHIDLLQKRTTCKNVSLLKYSNK